MIEVPILRPRETTKTQESVGNSPMVATATQEPVRNQLELLEDENDLLKEDTIELREELERWNDARKK